MGKEYQAIHDLKARIVKVSAMLVLMISSIVAILAPGSPQALLHGAPIEGLPEELSRCDKLKSMPSKLGDLTKLRDLSSEGSMLHLQYIEFSECSDLTFPLETLAQFTSLQCLVIYESGCFSSSLCSLTYLTLWISISVEPLSLADNQQLGCFSSSLCSLTYLTLWISISLEPLSLADNQQLVEIDSLPISVKEETLWSYSNLKSINLNCGLVGLEKLRITEGLENLNQLEAHTWEKVPVIQNLKHMESLRRLELSAAFEPCLQTINAKKWPSECITCGREAIGKSFTFPGLPLADSSVWKKDRFSWYYTFFVDSCVRKMDELCLMLNDVRMRVRIAGIVYTAVLVIAAVVYFSAETDNVVNSPVKPNSGLEISLELEYSPAKMSSSETTQVFERKPRRKRMSTIRHNVVARDSSVGSCSSYDRSSSRECKAEAPLRRSNRIRNKLMSAGICSANLICPETTPPETTLQPWKPNSGLEIKLELEYSPAKMSSSEKMSPSETTEVFERRPRRKSMCSITHNVVIPDSSHPRQRKAEAPLRRSSRIRNKVMSAGTVQKSSRG